MRYFTFFLTMSLKSLSTLSVQFSSIAQSCPTLCDPVDHSTPPCRSPTPRVYSNSSPLSLRCQPTISSSVIPFSSCLQSFPASGSFQVSQMIGHFGKISDGGMLKLTHFTSQISPKVQYTQTHVHRVSDAIQPSHPLSSPSPPAPNPSQHQSLFQRVNSSHEVAKVLEFQLQHQSFQ